MATQSSTARLPDHPLSDASLASGWHFTTPSFRLRHAKMEPHPSIHSDLSALHEMRGDMSVPIPKADSIERLMLRADCELCKIRLSRHRTTKSISLNCTNTSKRTAFRNRSRLGGPSAIPLLHSENHEIVRYCTGTAFLRNTFKIPRQPAIAGHRAGHEGFLRCWGSLNK